ncbi:hypothetical protein Tco_1294130 [Tanacetum coccineum]
MTPPPSSCTTIHHHHLPQSSPPSQSNHQGHKGRDCFCGKNHHEGGLVRWAAATMGWVGVTATEEGVGVGLGTSRGACLFGGSRHHKGAIGLAVDSRGGCQVVAEIVADSVVNYLDYLIVVFDQEHFLRHCELHNGLNYTSDIVSYTMVSSYFLDIVSCTMVSFRSQTLVLALENVKTAQDLEITSLKKRVKKLEKKIKARTLQLKRSTAEPSTPPITTTVIEDEDLIIAQTLMKMRSEKSKEKAKERGSKEKSGEPATRPTRGVTMQEPSESRTRKVVPPSQHDLKDKGKAKMIEPGSHLRKRIRSTMMEADYELAQRLQAEEQGELTIEERHEDVNSFVPIDSEVVEGSGKKTESSRKETVSKKRAGEELDKESVKRQKLEDDAEKFDWKTHIFLQKTRVFIRSIRQMKLVKERFETASAEGYEKLLWGDLITLFEPSEEDEIWKAQQDYTLISWRLFDSYGIHLLLIDTRITIHMLVERKYTLTQEMLSRMLSRRLEVNLECVMAYKLLRFTRSQLKKGRIVRNKRLLNCYYCWFKLLLLVINITTAGCSISTAGEDLQEIF